ncbi:MAG: aminopeptidase P family protein [Ignavibacteriales bacterium]|nr:aminopeptidase P family protein [Ignavibacteriales bacterium]
MKQEYVFLRKRLHSLREILTSMNLDCFLITFQPHLRYITGFSGSSGLAMVTRSGAYIITDGRYATQIRNQTHGWKIFITSQDLFEALRDTKLLRPHMRIGFDGNTLVFSQFKRLKNIFPKIIFLPKADAIERIAIRKDETEITAIKHAAEITDRVFTEILQILKPGVSELDIAAEISYRHKIHGAEGDAFPSIVASGHRSALPHGLASENKIKKGDLVTLDFGSIYCGYHCDMTRTVGIGSLPAKAKKIYQVVLDAQMNAIEFATSDKTAKEVDHVARQHITKSGFGKYFRHSLGHGIGLQIHEQPRLSVLSKAVLQPGNVVTIEPGIYIPDFGGVRIEDDIVITNGYPEILNKSPKELIIL